jgi:hypothetical protein
MKKVFLFVGFFFLVSGCTSFSDQKDNLSVFVPQEGEESIAELSPDESDKASLIKNNVEYFFVESQKIAHPSEKDVFFEYRLYSTHPEGCREEEGLCIFKIYKNEKEIFSFEENMIGQMKEIYGGMPVGWENNYQIIFVKKEEIATAHRTFFSLFNIYSQEYDSRFKHKVVYWKNDDPAEKNSIITLTKGGTQYFFDPFNSGAFKAYRIIDVTKEFYAGGNGTQNLSFIGSVEISPNAKVMYDETRGDGYFFRIEDGETTDVYQFTPQNGFEKQND